MAWDPDQYLRFADHRTRPGLELIARIPEVDAARIVDLGAGTGQLTAILTERWPDAAVLGIDSSPEMVERARRGHPGPSYEVGTVEEWDAAHPVDLVFSNASLHWVDDHRALFPRLRSRVAAGGVVAVQMPDNWNAPTHRIPAGILDEGDWPERARSALLSDRLARPAVYAGWLQPAAVDLWRTTYYQRLTGDDPVWAWVTGSVLRPVLDALEPPDWDRFAAMCRERYAAAYPVGSDGVTTVPFSRLFVVARVP